MNTQAAAVVNAGVGVANSGGNTAVGNASSNNANTIQSTEIATDNAGPTSLIAGTVVGSNNGEASNTSDGLATISSGDAAATGNESSTNLRQEANGAIDGNGAILNTQLGLVTNTGVGIANSGDNDAIGNDSDNNADLEQDVDIASDNADEIDVIAGIITASNDGTASNASDGEANITTGKASAAGNRSQTVLAQNADGDIDGLGLKLNTQVGAVVNAGVGVANTGGNLAVGNTSENDAELDQDVEIASDNDTTVDINAMLGGVTGANSGTAENASDGTADIRTGNAQATGNASATHFTQDADGHVNGLGLASTPRSVAWSTPASASPTPAATVPSATCPTTPATTARASSRTPRSCRTTSSTTKTSTCSWSVRSPRPTAAPRRTPPTAPHPSARAARRARATCRAPSSARVRTARSTASAP